MLTGIQQCLNVFLRQLVEEGLEPRSFILTAAVRCAGVLGPGSEPGHVAGQAVDLTQRSSSLSGTLGC